MLNRKTANALGLIPPAAQLVAADEVIEPPLLKWSDLNDLIGIKEDRYAEEKIQA